MKVNGQPHAEANLLALKEYPLLGLGLRAGLDSLKVADSVPCVRSQTIFLAIQLYQSLFLLKFGHICLIHSLPEF
jgi:hypothetical protein